MTIGLTAFLIFAGALWLWAFWIEPNWFHLRRETLQVGEPLAQPFTVLHLSDLHFIRKRFFLSRFFDRLARLAPDLIFITGDLIDNTSGIAPCITSLKKLRAKKGIYAVLGNHDYRAYPPLHQWLEFLGKGCHCFRERPEGDVTKLKEALARAGIHVLLNQNILVKLSGGDSISLIGLDDPVSKRADLPKAFEGLQNGAVRLTLTHSPITFPALAHYGVDAAFAGHTHGGQIRLPGIGALPTARRLVAHIVDSTNEYGFYGIVCRGMGAQELVHPRLFCRPEAVFVTIKPKTQ